MYIGPSFLTPMNAKMTDLENTHKIILILGDTMTIKLIITKTMACQELKQTILPSKMNIF